jgi:hypothetical protein
MLGFCKLISCFFFKISLLPPVQMAKKGGTIDSNGGKVLQYTYCQLERR